MPLTPRQTFIGGGAPGGVYPAPHAASHEIGGPDPITPTLIGAVPVSLAVTDYIGGGPTKLDGVPTVVLNVPRLFSFVHITEGYRVFRLRGGTDPTNPNAVIHPQDFNASTNAKVWEMVS